MRIETKRLYIRQMTEDDFERISRIWTERCPTLFEMFDGGEELQEKFLRGMWETTQDPTILTYMIFLRDGDRFCGRVNMQKLDEEIPELGIDLLGKYQNQGYGPELVWKELPYIGNQGSHHSCKCPQYSRVPKDGGGVHTRRPLFFEGRGESGKGSAGKTGDHHGGPVRAGIPLDAGYGHFRCRTVTLPKFERRFAAD